MFKVGRFFGCSALFIKTDLGYTVEMHKGILFKIKQTLMINLIIYTKVLKREPPRMRNENRYRLLGMREQKMSSAAKIRES